MPKTLELFFDLGSPASWLTYTQVPKLVAERGAEMFFGQDRLDLVREALS